MEQTALRRPVNRSKATPEPLWLWDPRLSGGKGGYRLTRAGAEATGQRAGTVIGYARMLSLRETYLERQRERTDALAAQLFAGEMTIQEWVLAMREAIKETYITQYVLASGGRGQLGPTDWGRLGGLLRVQYGFLQRFAQDIVEGRYSSLEAIQNRAGMYLSSSRQAFERAEAARRGLSLPAYPGDGTSDCKTNCHCHWDFVEEVERWLCTWVRTVKDSCVTCVERAGRWAPYIIEK